MSSLSSPRITNKNINNDLINNELIKNDKETDYPYRPPSNIYYYIILIFY